MQQQNSNDNDNNPNNKKKRTRNQIRNRSGDGFSSLSSSRSSTTRGRRRVSSKKVFRTGRWDKSECEAFERGIQIYGKSNWTRIATLIPTRTAVQVKSHAQAIYGRCDRTTWNRRRHPRHKTIHVQKQSNQYYYTDDENDNENDNDENNHDHGSNHDKDDNDDINTNNNNNDTIFGTDQHDKDDISLAASKLLHVAHSKVQNRNDDVDNILSVANNLSPWNKCWIHSSGAVQPVIRPSSFVKDDAITSDSKKKKKNIVHHERFLCHSPPLRFDHSHVTGHKEHCTTTAYQNTDTPKNSIRVSCISTPAARVTPTDEYHHTEQLQMQNTTTDDNNDDSNVVPLFYHGNFQSTKLSPMKRVYKCNSSEDDEFLRRRNKNDEHSATTPIAVRPMHQQCNTSITDVSPSLTLSPVLVVDAFSGIPPNNKNTMIPISPINIVNETKSLDSAKCYERIMRTGAITPVNPNAVEEGAISFITNASDVAESCERSAAMILLYMSSCAST